MGWESRRYEPPDRNRGGFPALLRRMFGQGEDFYGWGITLYRAWGIDVRIHLLFIIYIVIELIRALPRDNVGIGYRAAALASLFTLVLLHEYGHCIACRRLGGTANRIVLWPLGGLAFVAPPPNWRAELITTIGGPAVHVILFPLFAGSLLGLGVHWSSVFFNPFTIESALGGLHLPSGELPFWLYWLWWLHVLNSLLFLFNMLLPMYPMDAGRIVHCLLWRRVGHRRATDLATKIGFTGAAVLGVIGAIVPGQQLLLGLAVFGAVECWQARRRLAMEQAGGDPALAQYDFDRGFQGFPSDDTPRESTRQARARERREREAESEQAELDRILAKIARSGMGSLTRAEKRWLERATEQRRRE
jgi:stage IV sporulation protein FB